MHNNCSLDRLIPFEEGIIRCSKSKSLLSDITKYLNLPTAVSSKQNVELGLEIEINESVQRVLRDDGSSDDLLAVTIIRPSDSDLVHETTVALNKDDVKEFIALVERHRTKHQIIDKKSEKDLKKTKKDKEKEKEKEKERKSRSKKDTRGKRDTKDSKLVSDTDAVISKPESKEKRRKRSSSKRSDEQKQTVSISHHNPKVSKVHLSTFGDNPKQVYTTINTFDKLKEVLPCQNKHRSDKPGVPCICQNCGIMDVLVQSQKGPVVEFPPLDEVRQSDRDKDKKERHKKKETKYHQPNTSGTLDIDILKEINVRINNLEKRLAVQEETAVSKDYLKHVLHKIFSQYKND